MVGLFNVILSNFKPKMNMKKIIEIRVQNMRSFYKETKLVWHFMFAAGLLHDAIHRLLRDVYFYLF